MDAFLLCAYFVKFDYGLEIELHSILDSGKRY
jgi:hypothetical protein